MNESGVVDSSGVVYWALNNQAVTGFYLSVSVFTILLAFWIIYLNLLVFDTLVRKSSSEEPTDIFVSSLSMTDALSGVCLLYNAIYVLTNFQNRYECMFRLGLFHLLGLTSVFHMLALTFDRYLKIVKPYHYSKVFNRVSVIGISVTIWIVFFLFGYVPLMGWNKPQAPVTEPNEPVCGYFVVFNHPYLKLLVSLFFCPLVLMIVVYLHIFKIARRHAKVIAVQEQHKDKKTRDRHSLKYTKTVCLIVGLYFIAWIPSGVLLMLEFDDRLSNYTTIQKGTLLVYMGSISFLNSLVNPIIYALKITSVRVRFRTIFCRKLPKPAGPEEDLKEGSGSEVTKTTSLSSHTEAQIGIEEIG